MSFSRRHFLASTSGAAAGSGRLRRATRFAQGAPIKLGSVLDNSGNLDIYGKPMVHGDARWRSRRSTPPAACSAARSRSIQYDTQSDIALYTKYAQQLARDDKVDVVHGGITSASREAIRQTFRRANIALLLQRAVRGRRLRPQLLRHRHDAGAGGRADRRDRA